MLSAPSDLTTADVEAALSAGWGVTATSIDYRPVGFGSHHWAVTTPGGERWFVTADRASEHLEPALRTAIALRTAGLEFVVAPRPTVAGAATFPVAKGYLVALYPFVDGESSDFGQHDPAGRPSILEMLERLHGTAAPEPILSLDLDLPYREELEQARTTDGDTGPYSRRTQALLVESGKLIDDLLARYDRLREGEPPPAEWVVTHGEPHPGNILRTPYGLRMVDWDTVRLAPAARDLWQVDDRPAYAFFRLRWRLEEIASFAAELSTPHTENANTAASFRYLRDELNQT